MADSKSRKTKSTKTKKVEPKTKVLRLSPPEDTVDACEALAPAEWPTSSEREATIEAVNLWADNLGVSILMLGSTEERADFAPAIVGVTETPRPAVVYDYDLLIECFMRTNDWTSEEAVEWYDFNTARGIQYMPMEDNPPIVLNKLDYG